MNNKMAASLQVNHATFTLATAHASTHRLPQEGDLPILTLRNQVLFPGALLRIKVGRPVQTRCTCNALCGPQHEILVYSVR